MHEAVAARFLPMVREKMPEVEFRGDEQVARHPAGHEAATEEDWYAEYLDLILAVKVVKGLEEAAAHIEKYGSSHTDGICSSDAAAHRAVRGRVDSAVVTVNASTRLNDGGIFGLGAEIGHQHGQAARAGPHGPQGAHHLQVGPARQRGPSEIAAAVEIRRRPGYP